MSKGNVDWAGLGLGYKNRQIRNLVSTQEAEAQIFLQLYDKNYRKLKYVSSVLILLLFPSNENR